MTRPRTQCDPDAAGNEMAMGDAPPLYGDKKPRRAVDPELAALAKVDRILAGLSEAGRWRVCQWLSSKHNLFPEAPREDR